MKLLRPVASFSTLSIKIGSDLAKRLTIIQTAARGRGLMLDVDTPLTKALARVVRQAEADLYLGQETPPAAPVGAMAASFNPRVVRGTLNGEGSHESN